MCIRDSSIIAIDTIAVEKEVADNMYQRSELDYLIYNDPVGYAEDVYKRQQYSTSQKSAKISGKPYFSV